MLGLPLGAAHSLAAELRLLGLGRGVGVGFGRGFGLGFGLGLRASVRASVTVRVRVRVRVGVRVRVRVCLVRGHREHEVAHPYHQVGGAPRQSRQQAAHPFAQLCLELCRRPGAVPSSSVGRQRAPTAAARRRAIRCRAGE